MPTTFYTKDEYANKELHRLALADIHYSMIKNLVWQSKEDQNDHREKSEKEGYWHYIPNDYGIEDIHKTLYKIRRKMSDGCERIFLELGSGMGYFTAMAKWAGFDATGIEFDKKLHKKACELFLRKLSYNIKFILGDICKHSELISKADVIYFYSPFRDEKAASFLKWVVKNAKKGAYLIMATHCPSERRTINSLTAKKAIKFDKDLNCHKVLTDTEMSEKKVVPKFKVGDYVVPTDTKDRPVLEITTVSTDFGEEYYRTIFYRETIENRSCFGGGYHVENLGKATKKEIREYARKLR